MVNELDLALLQIQQLKYDPEVSVDEVLSMPSVRRTRVKTLITVPKLSVRDNI